MERRRYPDVPIYESCPANCGIITVRLLGRRERVESRTNQPHTAARCREASAAAS